MKEKERGGEGGRRERVYWFSKIRRFSLETENSLRRVIKRRTNLSVILEACEAL